MQTTFIMRTNLADDAFLASLTGPRQTKKTYSNRGTYTVKNVVLESTYMHKLSEPRDTLERWSSFGVASENFADDRAWNDHLFYKRDPRRSICLTLYTPAEAWFTFVVPEIGLSAKEFLATGATLEKLEQSLAGYKALPDDARASLHFLLESALNETVDVALRALLVARNGVETEDEARPVDMAPARKGKKGAKPQPLGGYTYIGGYYVWRG